MCGAKRGQEIQRCRPKYNKNGLCVCVFVGVFAGLVTITGPWTSLEGLLNVSCGLAIGWYALSLSLSVSVCLSFLVFFQGKSTDLPSINSLKMKHSSEKEEAWVKLNVNLAGQSVCVCMCVCVCVCVRERERERERGKIPHTECAKHLHQFNFHCHFQNTLTTRIYTGSEMCILYN